jgi:hypothetical protein
LARFRSHIGLTNERGCLLWAGITDIDGYGIIHSGTCKGRNLRAHRVAWELTNGPIPAGMHVLHRCDNRPCIEPSHLFLGTQADNMADKKAKGRSSYPRTGTSYRFLRKQRQALRSRQA